MTDKKPKTVVVKGFITQTKWWGDKLILCSESEGDNSNSEFRITHRPVEIEVTIASLRFDPEDKAAIDRIIHAQTVASLNEQRADSIKKTLDLEQQIKDMLCLTVMD
jgi:hypothetical protein